MPVARVPTGLPSDSHALAVDAIPKAVPDAEGCVDSFDTRGDPKTSPASAVHVGPQLREGEPTNTGIPPSDAHKKLAGTVPHQGITMLGGQIRHIENKKKKMLVFHGVHTDLHDDEALLDSILSGGLKSPSERGGAPGRGRIPSGVKCFGVENWSDAIFASASARYAAAYGGRNDRRSGDRKVILLVCYVPQDLSFFFKQSTLEDYTPLAWENDAMPLEIRVPSSTQIEIEGILRFTIPAGVLLGNWFRDLSSGKLIKYDNLTIATIPKDQAVARLKTWSTTVVKSVREWNLVDHGAALVGGGLAGVGAGVGTASALTTYAAAGSWAGPVGACVGAIVGLLSWYMCGSMTHQVRDPQKKGPDPMTKAASALGVSKYATQEQAKAAYRKAVLEAHPDRPGGSKERFFELTAAHAAYRVQRGWDEAEEHTEANGPSRWADWLEGIFLKPK